MRDIWKGIDRRVRGTAAFVGALGVLVGASMGFTAYFAKSDDLEKLKCDMTVILEDISNKVLAIESERDLEDIGKVVATLESKENLTTDERILLKKMRSGMAAVASLLSDLEKAKKKVVMRGDACDKS